MYRLDKANRTGLGQFPLIGGLGIAATDEKTIDTSLNASGLGAAVIDRQLQLRSLRLGFHRGRLWELRLAGSSILNLDQPLPMPKEGEAIGLAVSVLWHELVAILRRATNGLRAKCSRTSEPSQFHHLRQLPPPYGHTGLDE